MTCHRFCCKAIKLKHERRQVATLQMNENAKICVPVGAESFEELRAQTQLAVEVAGIVELRLDYLREVEIEKLSSFLNSLSIKTLLTFRPKEQGGKSSASLEERITFWTEAKNLPATFFDFELDLATILKDDDEIDWRRVIVSHHDFEKTPDDLEKIYEAMTQTPARVLKIATQANDATDSIKHLQLLERAKREGRELIPIAMGEAGKFTRILFPSLGSFLTYAALDEESGTAPGQVAAKDLHGLYRFYQLNTQTKITGLVGRPVSHSLSPHIHNKGFETRGVDAVYLLFDISDVSAFLKRIVHPCTREVDLNFFGLSVTAPHKQNVMKHLDWVDETAKEIGAVNTVVVENDLLFGYNTDAVGFITPLKNSYGELKDARCALIGAGGAARASSWALRNEGANVTIFARDSAKAKGSFDLDCKPLDGANFGGFDIVVNTTPLGTKGKLENETPAVAEQLKGVGLVYDLVYNPFTTVFMREAQSVYIPTIGGLEMLVAQAAKQFKLWTGLDAPKEVMSRAAVAKVSGKQ